MTEISEELNFLKVVTQYDVKQSTPLLESIRFLMSEEKSAKAAITFINKQVPNALSKELAFDILIKILPDCSQSILDENSKTWVNYAVSKHQEEFIAMSRFQFLVAIYHRCHTNQDFYKSVVSNALPKIIDTCVWVHDKSAEAEHALHCLYFTMKYFASSCIVHKKRIEEYVLKFLDSSSKIAIILEAAKCYHILNQIGGAGPNGSIHIKNYEDNFEKLYKTLNVLYDAMFENINEFRETIDDISNVIKFNDIPTYLGTMDVYKILSRRMENIVVFLIEMLQTDYKVKKTIKPEILHVIQRGLDIHVHGDENDPNRVLFNQNIQQHQIKLLFLLKALVHNLQHNFLRHSTIKILFRYLARVTECNCYNLNSFYKSTIYGVIKYWLQCSGEQIDAKTYEKLIEIIIKDITPNKTTLVLQINVNNSKSKGKNASVIATGSPTQNNNETPRLHETQVANCKAALGLLEVLFKSVNLNVKKTTCAQLFHVITITLLDICANYYCPPYTSNCCRLGLFKVLIAIFDQPTFSIDIDLAVNILSLAQNGDDIELSQICQNGLKTLEKIVHPIQASIGQTHESVSGEENIIVTKKQADSSSITVLSNFLIQCNQTVVENQTKDGEINVTLDSNTEENDITSQTETSDAVTIESDKMEESEKIPEPDKCDLVEISDNEGVNDKDGDNNDNEEVLIVEEGEPLSKKRKADQHEVIYTFDISQGEGDGEDPMDSFVDELN